MYSCLCHGGFLLAFWANGRRIHALTTLFISIVSAAFFSGSVEFIQLYAPTRTTSFVDLATNTAGSVVGALDWLAGCAMVVAAKFEEASADCRGLSSRRLRRRNRTWSGFRWPFSV